ncbi:alpha/beta hydrolase family protein [Wolbachia endosymbiont (group B) of Pararge aegeria]
MHVAKYNKENEIHLIFFHGIGDNYKNAARYIQDRSTYLHRSNFHTHAHKYPIAFQNYITYAIASFLFLGTSILLPTLILLTNPMTSSTASLAILAALTCTFLSVPPLMIPFINKNQSLSKSSIEKINELMEKGVKSENIILFGHSFGGAVASEVLKYFTDKNIKLGGVIFTSTFSSFHNAIKHFPIPQAKILSVLPSCLLKKMLKVLNLDFDIISNIQKLQNDNIPIVVINHARDTLIPYPAQLAKAVDDLLLNRNSIKIVNLRGFTDNPHNGVLSSWQLSENLADLMPNKIMNR